MDKTKILNKAKALASQLFDLKLLELERMDEQQKADWMKRFSGLTHEEFEDVRQQVIQAKTSQQAQVGWQSLPHDLSVLVFCLVTVLFSLKAGVIAGVVTLALLVSLSQVYFNQALYKVLGFAGWLTYPAYIGLGVVLFMRGMPWWQIALVIVLAWGGTFVLAAIMAIPMTLFLQARAGSNKLEAKAARKKK